MPPTTRLYTTLVLFGKETRVSVASPELFRQLTGAVEGLLALTFPELKARGTVYAEKMKNVAPRKGKWSEKLREQYIDSFGRGRFQTVELFDALWGSDRHADAYARIHKHWGYGP